MAKPVHSCIDSLEGLKITRHKEPGFTAIYKDGEVEIIEWHGDKPSDQKITQLLKKLQAYLKHEYFKR